MKHIPPDEVSKILDKIDNEPVLDEDTKSLIKYFLNERLFILDFVKKNVMDPDHQQDEIIEELAKALKERESNPP